MTQNTFIRIAQNRKYTVSSIVVVNIYKKSEQKPSKYLKELGDKVV